MKEVKIESAIWMTQNLAVKTFRNGDEIPQAQSSSDWEKAAKEKSPAWCFYNDDPASEKKYGLLYNAYAVFDARGLAPKGWHIPSKKEWENLNDIKTKTDSPWKAKKGWDWNDGEDEFGFSALPGGHREKNFGMFMDGGEKAQWWTSTPTPGNDIFVEYVTLENGYFQFDNDNKGFGFSVRCVKGESQNISFKTLLTCSAVGRGYELYKKHLQSEADPIEWYAKNQKKGLKAFTESMNRLTRIDDSFYILVEEKENWIIFPLLVKGKKTLSKAQKVLAAHYEKEGYKVIIGLSLVNGSPIDFYSKDRKTLILGHDYANEHKMIWDIANDFDPKKLTTEVGVWKQKTDDSFFISLKYDNEEPLNSSDSGNPKMGYEGPWLISPKSLKKI